MFNYLSFTILKKETIIRCSLVIALAWVSFFIGLDRHVYPAMYFSFLTGIIYLFFYFERHRIPKSILFPLLPIIALCICTSVSWINGNGNGDFRYAWMWLSMIFLGLAAGSAFPYKTWIPMMFLPISLTLTFFVYAFTGQIFLNSKLKLLVHGSNLLGMLAGYAILIYVGNLQNMTKKQIKLFLLPAALIPFIILILSGCKGAFIALIATLFLCTFLYRSQKLFFGLSLILIASTLFILAIPTKSYYMNNIKQRVDHQAFQSSFRDRLVLWKAAWDGIKKNPVFGCQISNFKSYFNNFRKKNYVSLKKKYSYVGSNNLYHPHNIFLGILFGWGCIGAIAFILSTGATIFAASKKDFIFPIVIIFYQAVFGISGFNLYRKDGAYTFFIVYGLAIGNFYLNPHFQKSDPATDWMSRS